MPWDTRRSKTGRDDTYSSVRGTAAVHVRAIHFFDENSILHLPRRRPIDTTAALWSSIQLPTWLACGTDKKQKYMVEAQDSVVLRPAGIDITREMPTFFRIYLDTEEECALEQQTCTHQRGRLTSVGSASP